MPDSTAPASPRRSRSRAPRQLCFDDLGAPLCETTFCVVDLETTGGSPRSHAITEIGAVKVRGGEVLGTLQTLVDPGGPIPPEITVITGITTAMVMTAPPIDTVLPTLLEFIGDAVVVAHNARFDVGFIAAACERLGYPPPANRVVDTVALSRRLVGEEVPNCKLSTLASRLRLPHQPCHRALDDALATVDLLHLLLERAGSLGVTLLDDLLRLPTIAGHAQKAKLSLTAQLPRTPGVYLFRDRRGEPLYIGKATDLRSRVRSYFSGDTRRKIAPMLREAQRIDHVECPTTLHAGVLEARLIADRQPRYNRQGRSPSSWWVKLTAERYPRLSAVRTVHDDDATYLGPLTSRAAALRVIDAVHTAVPLRRCRGARRGDRSGRCADAQLGVAACPCAGDLDEVAYGAIVEVARRALTDHPEHVLGRLEQRMAQLAADDRFEEAADVRDRAAAFAAAITRTRRITELARAGTIVVRLPVAAPTIEPLTIVNGVLDASWNKAPRPAPCSSGAPSPVVVAEMLVVGRWLLDHADRIELLHVSGTLASPMHQLSAYRAGRPALAAR